MVGLSMVSEGASTHSFRTHRLLISCDTDDEEEDEDWDEPVKGKGDDPDDLTKGKK